jgi:hypothetical protein
MKSKLQTINRKFYKLYRRMPDTQEIAIYENSGCLINKHPKRDRQIVDRFQKLGRKYEKLLTVNA